MARVATGVAEAGVLDEGSTAYVTGLVRDVPDYPQPGVLFKDVTPLLADSRGLKLVVDALAALGGDIDLVAGIEARGFMLAAPVAYALGVGFVPLRKAGKLPPPVSRIEYALEYGTAEIELREATVPTAARVLLVDDVLATGGTLVAAARLLERAGALVTRAAVLLELDALAGRERVAAASLTGRLDALLCL